MPAAVMGSLGSSGVNHLQAALSEAHEKYALLHVHSKKSHEEACKYMPGGNTRTVLHTTPFPLTIASGERQLLHTIDGQQYTDFLGEYTAGIYGHSNALIRQAVEGALDHGWNYGGHNQMEQQLAKIVCERFSLDKVRFVNSGTEANMMALATAIAYTGRTKILVFQKGYHGSTISGRIPDGKLSINLPHDFVVGKYNDIEYAQAIVEGLSKGSLAAILVEPVLGSGGCFIGTSEFLSGLRELATEHGALLIFDEVMTSRLGYHGRGHELRIKPDMKTLGKWVGGGLSFGAFGGRKDIMSLYDPRTGKLEHAGTFNNNVFSMSAGIAGCRLMTAAVVRQLNSNGEALREKLVKEVFNEAGITGTIPIAPITEEMHAPSYAHRPPKIFVTGVGSMMTVHFAGPDKDLLGGLYYHFMLDNGIMLAQRGFIALSIEITMADIEAFVSTTKEFVHRYEQHLMW